MITYKKALEILKKGKIKLKNEKILSKNASLRISAENIYSPENYPSSDRAFVFILYLIFVYTRLG